jgi:hypothetical protein
MSSSMSCSDETESKVPRPLQSAVFLLLWHMCSYACISLFGSENHRTLLADHNRALASLMLCTCQHGPLSTLPTTFCVTPFHSF